MDKSNSNDDNLCMEKVHHNQALRFFLIAIALGCFILTPSLSAQAQTPEPPSSDLESPSNTPPASQRPSYLIGGDREYPPYEFLQDGQATGFNVDLMRAVADVMGFDIQIELGPWNDIRQKLENGEIDAVTGMAYSPERDQFFDFAIPHSVISFDIFVRLNSEIRGVEDLAGHKVIVQQGGIMDDYLKRMDFPEQDIIRVTNVKDALQTLSTGGGDCAMLNKMQAYYFIKDLGLTNLESIQADLEQRRYSFAVKEGNENLLFKLNDGLDILKANGTYAEIYDKWFGVYEKNDTWNTVKPYLPWIAIFGLVIFAVWGIWVQSLRSQVKKRTAELHRSEEKYRLLVTHASEGVAVVRDGRIILANPKTAEILGYPLDQLSNLNLADVIESNDRKDIMSGESANSDNRAFSCRVKTALGETRWVYIHSVDINWDEQPATLSLFMDFTNQYRTMEALRESEERYSKAFRTSPDAISISTIEDGRFLEVNEGFCKLTGYSESELIGKTSRKINLWARPDQRNHMLQVLHDQGEVNEMEILFRTKNGELAYGLLSAKFIDLDGHRSLLTITHNINVIKETEQKMRQQVEHLAALRAVDIAITSSFDIRMTLQVLLDQLRGQVGADAACIMGLNENIHSMTCLAEQGFHTNWLQASSIQVGSGLSGAIAMHGRSRFIENLQEFKDIPVVELPPPSEGFVSYYGVPLIAKGMVKGVLELYHRSSLTIDEDLATVIDSLADLAAIAIDNASLFNDFQQANNELVQAYDATIEGWAHALELRDWETEGHSKRVTDMTLELSRLMGIKDEELVHVRRGALLHDIGKMAIPDHILFKPGPLDDNEWKIMRKHPTYAYQLLSNIHFLRPALEIPYYHHERWDGSGYPFGLRGEQIPMSARVFAVIDVWDALLMDRPYRAGWPEEKVINYLRDEAGRQFDPAVVGAFIALVTKENQNERQV